MLDFADFIVLNKFEKRGAEDALRDVRKQVARNRKLFKTPPEALPVYPTIASQFNDAGVNALFGALCARLHEQWGRLGPGSPRASRRSARRRARRSSRARACATSRRSRPAAAVPTDAAQQAAEAAGRAHGLYRALERARRRQRCRRRSSASTRPASRRRTRRSDACEQAYNAALDEVGTDGIALLKGWPARREAASAAGVQLPRARPRSARAELQRVAFSPAPAEDRGAALRGLGRAARVPADRKPAGRLPLHRRHLPVQARGRGPDAHVRGRGHARAHQPAFPLPRARPPGDAALDRVRLDHALRRGPGRAARHLRPHRQLGRLDRLARRHEAALLGIRPVRAVDLGVDDDQRAGADDPRDVHEYRGRPAGREAAARQRPLGRGGGEDRASCSRAANARATAASCRPATTARGSGCSASAATRSSTPRPTRGSVPTRSRACAARCRPTSSRRTRRRTPASSRPSSRCG